MSYWLGLKQHCSKTPVTRVVVKDNRRGIAMEPRKDACCNGLNVFFVIVIYSFPSESGHWGSEWNTETQRGPARQGLICETPSNPFNSRPLKGSAACFRDSPHCVSIVTQYFSLHSLTSGWVREFGGDTMAHNGTEALCVSQSEPTHHVTLSWCPHQLLNTMFVIKLFIATDVWTQWEIEAFSAMSLIWCMDE